MRGHRLKPGRYLVTLRALKHGVVDDLSKPRKLTIKRKHKHKR